MAYKWVILPRAHQDVEALDAQTAKRILQKLLWIFDQEDPKRHGVLLMKRDIGDIRFRIGDYRVLAFIDIKKRTFFVAAIGHRREIYR